MRVADAVDIVILNCNNNGYIQNCIKSIRENTDGIYKLIVVDQNSYDGSKEWLKEAKVAHLILNKRNVGVAIGKNQGIKAGNYPWVVIVDSDIEIKDHFWLDKMWNYTIDRHIGMIEASVRLFDWARKERKFGGTAFCMIRRKCFEEIGLFDRNFFIGEDLDWYVRLEWSWWKTAYCYDVDILHLCGKTMHGSLEKRYKELERQRDELLNLKYTSAFLERTLGAYMRRRFEKEKELLGAN